MKLFIYYFDKEKVSAYNFINRKVITFLNCTKDLCVKDLNISTFRLYFDDLIIDMPSYIYLYHKNKVLLNIINAMTYDLISQTDFNEYYQYTENWSRGFHWIQKSQESAFKYASNIIVPFRKIVPMKFYNKVIEYDLPRNLHLNYKFNPNSKNIIYISNFHPKKNHEFLINIASKLPEDINIIFYGDNCDNEYYRKIVNLIDNRRLNIKIDQIINFKNFEGNFIHCIPSLYETVCFPIIETNYTDMKIFVNQSLENNIYKKCTYLNLDVNLWINKILETFNYPIFANPINRKLFNNINNSIWFNSQIKEIINQDIFFNNASVLDLGCGNGMYVKYLSEILNYNFDITAVDFVQSQIDLYLFNNQKSKTYLNDLNTFKINKKFDIIIIFNSINYVYNLNLFFQNLKSMMNENTKIIILTHDILSLNWIFMKNLYQKEIIGNEHFIEEIIDNKSIQFSKIIPVHVSGIPLAAQLYCKNGYLVIK